MPCDVFGCSLNTSLIMKLVQPIDKLLLICVNFIDSTTGVIN